MPSSVIRAFHYRPEDHALDVIFVTGRRYRYLGVPENLHRQMREAFSKGEFFNAHIRDHFPFQRMDG
jgi:lysyl-tRNA synthetase class 2